MATVIQFRGVNTDAQTTYDFIIRIDDIETIANNGNDVLVITRAGATHVVSAEYETLRDYIVGEWDPQGLEYDKAEKAEASTHSHEHPLPGSYDEGTGENV